jgi:hypothetical protein
MYRCAPLVSLLLACTPGGGASVVKQQPPASPVAPAPVAPPPAPPPAGWAVRLGGGDFDAVSPVAVTRAGETLVLTWGSDDLAVENPEAGAQPAGRGVHLVRIGPQGELRGVSRVGDGFHVESAVATEDGGLTIAGIHYERASFTGIGERDVPAGERRIAGNAVFPDAFVARVRPNGEVAWLRAFTGAEDQHLEHVVALPGGDVVVAGAFGRDGVLDDGAGGLKIVTLDRSRDLQWDVVLARFSGDGALRWARVVGGPRTDAIRGLDVLPDGNLALLGLCNGAARLARSGGVTPLACDPAATVVFVAVYTPDGEVVRARAYPEAQLGDPSDFAALSDGGVVIGGTFRGTLTLADGRTITSDQFFDGFVARLAADGEIEWLRHLRGPRSTGADAVAGDHDGGVWVWTSAEDNLAVGDGATYEQPLPRSGLDAVLLRFDRAGKLVSASLQGGKPAAQNLGDGAIDPMLGEVRAHDILVAPDGGLRLAGLFSVDVMLTDGEARHHLRTVDLRRALHLDGFVAAFPPRE